MTDHPNPTGIQPITYSKDGVSEIIIAFVAAVGVDLDSVEESGKKKLEAMGYETVSIRITRDVIPQFGGGARGGQYVCEYDRYWGMMDLGNAARAKFGSDVLALGVASEIAKRRKERVEGCRKIAYFVRSLKHPEEVMRLREIYPRGFYLFAIQASAQSRRYYLMHEMDMSKSDANKLMDRDRKELAEHGQHNVDTYHLADFFLCAQDESDKESSWGKDVIKGNMNRFIEILFGHPNKTPTFGEHAMFQAFSSSLRSADLSRQVGAVVTKNQEVLAMGANDCPSPKGGLYWPFFSRQTLRVEDVDGGRDYKRGGDSNRRELIALRTQIFRKAASDFNTVIEDGEWRKGLGSQAQIEMASVQREMEKELLNRLSDLLDKSSIRDLTEFGRMVHAEMEALLSCARRGISTSEAVLFSTTFPCHNCAKHIVAAGIRKVVFIQPYLKSKALKLHPDSIELVYPNPMIEDRYKSGKVQFEPFVGVGPRRFFDLFSTSLGAGYEIERKSGITGDVKPWAQELGLRLPMNPTSFLERESDCSRKFELFVALEKSTA